MFGSLVKNSASDRANLLVMESILLTAIVVGSLLYVVHVGNVEGDTTARPRENARIIARDALSVLAEHPACLEYTDDKERLACWHTYGRSLLGRHITETLHGDDGNLTAKIRSLLPPGARYNLYLDNGRGVLPLRALENPMGETVSASHTFAPAWNFAYVVPDFSCYDTDVPLNVTVIPVVGSSFLLGEPPITHVNFTTGYTQTLQQGTDPHRFTGYLPPDTAGTAGYPNVTGGRVESNFTYNTIRLQGRADYDAGLNDCPLGDAFYVDARQGLNESSLTTGRLGPGGAFTPEKNFTFGDTVTLRYDFNGYVNRVSPTDTPSITLRVYDPVPSLLNHTGYRERFNTSVTALSGEVDVPLGDDALLGPLLVIADINAHVTGEGASEADLTARLTDYFFLNHPDGTPAFAPVYRVVLEIWFPEWEVGA